MLKLKTSQLTPGMIVAKDVYSIGDHLIVPAGFQLTDRTITRLAFYTIPYIYIKDSVDLQDKKNDDSLYQEEEQAYSAFVKNSPEFKKFSVEFTEDVSKFKTMINDVVEKNAPLDVDTLLNDTVSLLKNALINDFSTLSIAKFTVSFKISQIS